MTRTFFALVGSAAFVAVTGLPASAAVQATFSAAALHSAQAAGKPIVVDVSAPWCSTCKAQAAIVDSLIKDPKFKDLVLLHMDYDSQKSAMRSLAVRERSTFVAFKGKAEVGRSTGATDEASIKSLFDKTN